MDPPPVQYVTTNDGMSIAYSVTGDGSPLVLMPFPISHLHLRWQSDPDFIQPLAARFRLIQYDGRGQGMSSRGVPVSFNYDDLVTDVTAVVDRLALTNFAIWADVFQADAAVRFAAQNPGRVRALILRNCVPEGEFQITRHLEQMANQDWDGFLRMVALALLPFTKGQTDVLAQSVTQADYVARLRVIRSADFGPVLDRVKCPVLLLATKDGAADFEEPARRVAGLLPQARLLLLKEDDFRGRHAQIAEDFLNQYAAPATPPSAPVDSLLSSRELDVLRLIAAGRSNLQIADELVLSVNTVQRHVSNILIKTGAANRTEAAGYARDHGIA
jgi:DNA-binding CsgD family transcriptional regulator